MNARTVKMRAAMLLLGELHDLSTMGGACNAQDWVKPGVKKNAKECAAIRREARRLLRVAISAVEVHRVGGGVR